jgi:MoaA/NifB/PqqE/SkfB family radical SAM enzyme
VSALATLAGARLAAALWRTPQRGRPLKVTAVLTERCHLRCDFCRLWESPNAGVPTATWIEFFRANPFLRWVNLTGGELFAKERLDELLDGIVAALPRLDLLDFPTAGQLPDVTVATVQRLLATRLPRLAVTVSLDGGPELHDSLRGMPGAFERAFETFARLRALRAAAHGRLTLVAGCTLTDRAEEQERTLAAELARRLPDFRPGELHFNLAHVSPHYYRNAAEGAAAGLRASDGALAVLRRRGAARGALGWIERQYARLAPRALRDGHPPMGCDALARTVFVGPDLTVHPCTIWERPLGNLADFGLSLERLLARAEVDAARAQIVARRCPGCFSPCEAVPAMVAHPWRTMFMRAGTRARTRAQPAGAAP